MAHPLFLGQLDMLEIQQYTFQCPVLLWTVDTAIAGSLDSPGV